MSSDRPAVAPPTESGTHAGRLPGWILLIATGALFLMIARRGRRAARSPSGPGSERRLPRGPVTQAIVPVAPAERVLDPPGRNVEQRLDEAIEESFPASDPVSVRIE